MRATGANTIRPAYTVKAAAAAEPIRVNGSTNELENIPEIEPNLGPTPRLTAVERRISDT